MSVPWMTQIVYEYDEDIDIEEFKLEPTDSEEDVGKENIDNFKTVKEARELNKAAIEIGRNAINSVQANQEKSTINRKIKKLKHKLYSCKQCEYTGSYNAVCAHTRYKRESAKIRYNCDQCDYAATQRQDLKHHKKRIHDPERTTKKRVRIYSKDSKYEGIRYSCDQCEYAATSLKVHDDHVRYKHSGLVYSCEECEYVSSRKDNLKKHENSKHKGIKYPCDLCDYMATQSENLKRQKERNHENDNGLNTNNVKHYLPQISDCDLPNKQHGNSSQKCFVKLNKLDYSKLFKSKPSPYIRIKQLEPSEYVRHHINSKVIPTLHETVNEDEHIDETVEQPDEVTEKGPTLNSIKRTKSTPYTGKYNSVKMVEVHPPSVAILKCTPATEATFLDVLQTQVRQEFNLQTSLREDNMNDSKDIGEIAAEVLNEGKDPGNTSQKSQEPDIGYIAIEVIKKAKDPVNADQESKEIKDAAVNAEEGYKEILNSATNQMANEG